MMSKFRKISVLLMLLGFVAQCGEIGALSGDVDSKFLPDSPVVVHSDLTFNDNDGEDVTIKAPWFIFFSRVTNGSPNRLYLASYTLDISTMNNGVITKKRIVIDPSKFCEDRAYIAILDEDETYERLDPACTADSPASGGGAASTRYESYFIESLPKSDNDIYNAEITGEGWFVDGDGIPVERLSMAGYLSTQ